MPLRVAVASHNPVKIGATERVEWGPDHLQAGGAGDFEVVISHNVLHVLVPPEQERLLRQMAARVACGGDGTISELLPFLAHSRAELGLLPFGTGNDLARALGRCAEVERVDLVTRRIVETGIASDGQVEILNGLEDNEEIVVVGHSGLRDGSKVLASNKMVDSFTG